MQRIFNMAVKDLKILSRDRMGAFFIIGFPILMGVFFGLVMGGNSSGGGSSKMNVALVDRDQSAMSQKFVDALMANQSVNVEVDELDAAKNSVRQGNRVALLVLEPGFGDTAGLFWETPPTIQIGADPSRMAEVAMLQGFVMEAIGQLATTRFQDLNEMKRFVERSRKDLADNPDISTANRLLMSGFLGSIENLATNIDALQQRATTDDAADSTVPQAASGFQFVNLEEIDISREVDPNSIRGQMSKSKSSWDISFPQAMMWGVLGCVAGFSISIARERSHGTMTRLQIAPVTQFEILAGKALACFLTVLFVIAMMTCLGLALGMQPGSYPKLAIASLCVALCFVGIMMVMASIGKTEQGVSGAGWAINMVMAMLGGGMIPVMFMPSFMQQMSVISPVKWGILAIEGAIWREFSIMELLLPCGILLAIGAVGLIAGTALLKRSSSQNA